MYIQLYTERIAFKLQHSARTSYVLRVILTADCNQHCPVVAAYRYGGTVTIGGHPRV